MTYEQAREIALNELEAKGYSNVVLNPLNDDIDINGDTIYRFSVITENKDFSVEVYVDEYVDIYDVEQVII